MWGGNAGGHVTTGGHPSWGGFPAGGDQLATPVHNRFAPLARTQGTLLPRGNGRSYGDSCLNPGGTLLLTRGLDRFVEFDPHTGVLSCEAGTTLAEIASLCLPQGWFLPVVPGTQFVTVGGAIANDVHGKNHHVQGSFGHHVECFELLRSDGERRVVRPGDADDMFSATVGGLGLTGLITWAKLRLRRVRGPWMEVESERFEDLDEFFDVSTRSSGRFEYAVAWVDCLASGARLGRGHFLRANHCQEPGQPVEVAPRASLPFPVTPPFSLVNRLTLRPFNALYYHRQRSRVISRRTHFQPFFYPLDGIGHWNRMYGPRGFLQHQSVLPPGNARAGVGQLLKEIARSGSGSFLAVLKEFGDRPSLGMLSFPRPGVTLALDFPNTGAAVLKLLDRLDAITRDLGGAVYPAKDARMQGGFFKQAYPAWERFQYHVDPSFSSAFWRRMMQS